MYGNQKLQQKTVDGHIPVVVYYIFSSKIWTLFGFITVQKDIILCLSIFICISLCLGIGVVENLKE